jgi:nickel-dependent lactate racemase
VDIELKYGRSVVCLSIPDKAEVTVLRPRSLPMLDDPAAALTGALDAPLGCAPLEAIPPPRSVAVAVPDETRPVPVSLLLPLLLGRMFAAWPTLSPDDVTIVVGGGLHRPMDEAGLARLIPEASRLGCRVVAHDARGSLMLDRGLTSRSTPVRVNAAFGAAGFKAVIGAIDPHQFVGFTGGAKGAVIGCGAAETIEANHKLMFQPGAEAGLMRSNPVREDLDEAGRLIGVDLAINVALDPDKRIVRLLAGEPGTVLRAGAATCAAIYGVELDEPFDLVVASCGGHPKDINLYQAQKGLSMAARALKPGGRLLLLAACPQGVGDDAYLDHVSRFGSPQEAMDDFMSGPFRVGPHKSFLFARTLIGHKVVVASELDDAVLRACHLTPGDAQFTLDRWVGGWPGRPRLAVVPSANTTYFHRRTA